jgi:hypothetical protein
MSDTKIKTSNIGNLAVTHALLHTDMDLTSKTVQVATPTSNTHPATKAYVDTEVANLIDSAPGTLDTLNELAAAVNDDANFNATIASSIATKLPLAGGTMTGNLQIYKAEPIITLQRSNNALLPGISWQGSGGAEAASIKLDGTSGATNTLIMSTYNGSTMAERLRLMTNAAGGIAVTGTISVTGTVDGVDIAARDAILTSTTTTADAALPKAGGTLTGDLIINTSSNGILKLQEGGADKGYIGAGGGGLYIKNLAGDVIFRNSSDADTIRIKDSGNVGIGTTSPDANLVIDYAGDDPTGATSRVGAFSIRGGHTTLDMGVNDDSPYNSWIQTRHKSTATYPTAYYNLTVNPLGGNVGIGDTNPLYKLSVNNGTSDGGIFRLYNEEVGLNVAIDGTTGSPNYTNAPRTVTFNATRMDSGTSPKLRLGGQGGVEIAADANNVRMVVLSNGNVGIDVPSPGEKLSVNGSVQVLGNNDANYSAKFISGYDSTHGLRITTRINASTESEVLGVFANSGGASPRLVLNPSNGWNVGIGETNPQGLLHVKSTKTSGGDLWTQIGPGNASSINIQNDANASNTNAAIYFRNSVGEKASIGARFIDQTTGETQLRFSTTNSSGTSRERMFLDGDGNVGIGTTSSSAKLHVVDGVSDTVIADNAVVKIDGTGGDGLAFGNTQSTPYSSWMQAGYLADGYSPAFNNGYPILINPIGGNVMIGSNVPNSYLHIDKRTTSTVSGRSQFQIRADGSGARAERIKRITYCYRPMYNQYTYHRIILGGGVYGAGQSIRYRVTFTTGHASGHGFVEGVLSVYAHHSTTKMHLTGNTKYVRHYSNGSYYGWTSNPDVDFFFSNQTNANACVIMRVQGHGNHNSNTFDLICDHHIDLEIHGSDANANTEMLFIGHSAPGDMGAVFSGSTLN